MSIISDTCQVQAMNKASFLPDGNIAGSSNVDGAVGAYMGSLVSLLGLVAFIKTVVPREVWNILHGFTTRLSTRIVGWISSDAVATICEFDGYTDNEVYRDAEVYVAGLVKQWPVAVKKLRLTRAKNATSPNYALTNGDEVKDSYAGVDFTWCFGSRIPKKRGVEEAERWYTLRFHKRHRGIIPKYLSHIASEAKTLKHQSLERMLYTNTSDPWGRPWKGVPFTHPSTFDSMAMDPRLKLRLKEDLSMFKAAQGFYRRVGRSWKRGYLLHGPPGTGKSSLIAAMANFTGFDVYDMELTEVGSNAELRKLLMTIPSKSIIVIEDIDCSLELKKREAAVPKKKKKAKKSDDDPAASRVTLSGLLNFSDGLWSSCGDERIIIFTTNFVDKIDPALLRSGRMDFHIHMSYCCFEAFKVLVKTHLGVDADDHGSFGEIEKLLGCVEVTPADVAEVLVMNRDDGIDAALETLIRELKEPNSKLRQKKNLAAGTIDEEDADKGEEETGDADKGEGKTGDAEKGEGDSDTESDDDDGAAECPDPKAHVCPDPTAHKCPDPLVHVSDKNT